MSIELKIKGLEIEDRRELVVEQGNFLVTAPGKTKAFRATYVSLDGMISAESYRPDYAIRDLTYKVSAAARAAEEAAKSPMRKWLEGGGIVTMYLAAGCFLWWFLTWAPTHLR